MATHGRTDARASADRGRYAVEKVHDVLEGGDNGPIMTRDNNTGPVSRAPRGAGADGLGAE